MSVAATVPVEIKLPKNETKNIGAVIHAADSSDLIDGVIVTPVNVHPDDRGYFLEVARLGSGLVESFPAASQVSAALSYPGTIKAFHYHRKQTDFWVPVQGMLQVALVDLRRGSETFGLRNTLYVGVHRTWSLLIPPGVGHGYKVIGQDAAMIVYLTDHYYDPKDEGRIAYNDAGIRYDWETQYK